MYLFGRKFKLGLNLKLTPKKSEANSDEYIPILDRYQHLYKIDTGKWRKAHQIALDPTRPRREQLMDVYQDAILDTTLQAKLQTRNLNILNTNFEILDSNGDPDAEKKKELQKPWFFKLLKLIQEQEYYGYSLPVFFFDMDGKVVRVEEMPRENVIPEYRAVLPDLYTEQLYYLDDPQFQDNYLLFDSGHLGLLLECARYTIFKKQAVSHWSLHQQLFGMPYRHASTDSNNKKIKDDIAESLAKMGTAGYGVFPKGTDINFLEGTKTDPFKIYQEAIRVANSEITNRVLGSPQTDGDTGSMAREVVNKEVSQDINKGDLRLRASDINESVLPLLNRWGYDFEGYKFEFRPGDALKLGDSQSAIDQIIMQYSGYQIPPDYFLEKYGVPVLPMPKKT